ncbi:hypothetical protein GHT06_021864 [Daphnia sinensis]|uniref:OCEL domain-containing protein n=1 Tax=Daphnia sinensis TaxID=1820382 RepID=A0AAD5KWX9_9CRUS|nr:hypothetical protein GHT06_021864 [Daphnia sinensis]
MAVLADGVQYGLSAHGLSSENKSLVFVKLTDSSFKAIEEYLRIKLKTAQHPTVQFLGNEGRLWFPSAEEGRGSAFSFNLSSSSVAGGPQGSFECVQQCGSRSLESLGVMGLKMNIKAKDDVYEATRQRMAVAEEESKKNCTRVIKLACGPDIGRVVKIRKQAAAVFPPRRDRGDTSPPTSAAQPTSQHHHHRGGSLSSTTSSTSSLSSLYPSSTHHSSSHVQNGSNAGGGGGGIGRSSTSSPSLGGQRTTSNAISPLPRSAASPSYPTASSISSNPSMTLSSSTLKDGYSNGGSGSMEANPELMRRPLRERIIHLLAIRSYKKPELVNRLHREGLKEKDKKLIMNVLSAIALMKDQAYHLARHIWNDVHDDWPFYTDQERQILKRRKPQNLTPPVSDSSSGSGHSPPSSSLHSNGSPVGSSSAIHKTSASPNGGGVVEKRERGEKRPSQQVLAGLDPLDAAAVEAAANAAKKQRISLYKKPDSSQSTHHHSSVPDSRNAQQQMAPARSSSSLKVRPSPPSHHQQQQQQQQQQHYHNNNKDNHHQPQLPPAHQQHYNNNHQHNHHRSENQNHYRPGSLKLSNTSSSSQPTTVVSTRVTSSTDGPDTPNSSPDSMSAEHMTDTTDVVALSASTTEPEPEPYTLQYRTIVSGEQRSRYKEDFNSQYNEYRNLHKAIDKVSKRFSHLEEELRQQHEGTTAWQRIKSQIVREYRENLRDAKYREAKRRFQHLHEKLAHIKRLVLEWDTTQTCRS